MKRTNDDDKFAGMEVPQTGNLQHQQELKIPLLSYRKTSRIGLWLLILPLLFIFTVVLKYELGMLSPVLSLFERFFAYISANPILTYLIPLIFVGLPLAAMIINLLAFCHFSKGKDGKELLITVKLRPLNIALFLLSFAVLAYAFLPDALP